MPIYLSVANISLQTLACAHLRLNVFIALPPLRRNGVIKEKFFCS